MVATGRVKAEALGRRSSCSPWSDLILEVSGVRVQPSWAWLVRALCKQENAHHALPGSFVRYGALRLAWLAGELSGRATGDAAGGAARSRARSQSSSL